MRKDCRLRNLWKTEKAAKDEVISNQIKWEAFCR